MAQKSGSSGLWVYFICVFYLYDHSANQRDQCYWRIGFNSLNSLFLCQNTSFNNQHLQKRLKLFGLLAVTNNGMAFNQPKLRWANCRFHGWIFRSFDQSASNLGHGEGASFSIEPAKLHMSCLVYMIGGTALLSSWIDSVYGFPDRSI